MSESQETMSKSRSDSSKNKKSSLGKKVLLVLGGLGAVFVLAALIVPLVVDVDKYRPTLLTKVNEQINGKVELGKLGLSLWGQVKIDIDGLKVTDSKGTVVVDVKDASFNLPFLSLLTGRPELRVNLTHPMIQLMKQKDGKINAMTLMKEEPKTSSSSGASTPSSSATTQSSKEKSQATEVPAIVMHSRLTFLLNHAKLSYSDQITGDTYKVDDLNFKLKDVSPSSNMPFEITANLDLLMQKKIKVTGPITFKGNVKAESAGGEFSKADAKAVLKLDDAEISDPGTFHKAKGVALGAELEASVGKNTFAAPIIKFRIADVTIDGQASGKTENNLTSIDFKAHSNRIDIEKLGDLSPMVKEYGLNGQVELSVSAKGPTDKLSYGADLKLNKVVLQHESMKQPLVMNGSLVVVTNELQDLKMRLEAKDFDLNLNGSMQNFMAPRFRFSLVSTNMDLDGLLKASEKAAQARKENAQSNSQPSTDAAVKSAGSGTPPVVDYNAMFKPLREIPIAAAAAGTFDFSLKRIKSTGVVIQDLKGQLALNNLMMSLKDFSMRIFDGSIKGTMSFNARSAKPEVGTNIVMSGLQTTKMVESQMPFAKNSVKGAISSVINIGGPGLNQSDIISAWKGNGTFDIKNAVFSTMDIGKQIKDGVLNKLPEFAKSKIKVPDSVVERQGEYENVAVKFALASGILNINDINGKAHPNKGLDVKGNGTVHLSNYALDMNLDLIDTYNLLGGDSVAKDSRYGHFALSPKVGGTLFSPKFDWGTTIARLAQNAAKQQGEQALKKALGDKIGGGGGGLLNKVLGGGSGGGDKKDGGQNSAPKPADAVKALKGLFGH